MKKNDFYIGINEALELENNPVNDKTAISLSSIQILALIVFIDEKFQKQIRIIDLKEVKTISDLMRVIGPDNFTD
jgi:acyl carrier protein